MKIKSLLIGNISNKRMIELHLERISELQYKIKKVGFNVASAITWNFPADDLEGILINFTKLHENDISCDNFIPKSVSEYMQLNGLKACGFRE